VDGGGGRRAPAEDVAHRRLDVRLDVEVVRQVALGIEVDGQDAQPGAPEHVREVPHRGRLAGAALLREDRDLLGHRAILGAVAAARRAAHRLA
jgi:hypothetical protein